MCKGGEERYLCFMRNCQHERSESEIVVAIRIYANRRAQATCAVLLLAFGESPGVSSLVVTRVRVEGYKELDRTSCSLAE